MTMANTIKIRIPVAVDHKSNWAANGWNNGGSWIDMMDSAMDGLEQGENRFWVEVYLPVPEIGAAITVQGEVIKVE